MADLKETLHVIQKDLQIPDQRIEGDVLTETMLKTYLTEVVRDLLDRDFNRLLTAMYRIDVAEESFVAALNNDDPTLIPSEIAGLIIERERRKIDSRWKYS